MDISIRNLSKRYGNVQAINDVNLTIADGETVGFLGRNGAGKTTTMECLLGLRTADSGDILIGGKTPAAVKHRIGAVLQNTALQDKITAREALNFFAGFFPSPPSTASLLDQFGLVEKADAAFDTLSGGQKQRLALALAMVNSPAVLVLDEPTAGLDPEARQEVHGLIRQSRGNRTVLLSTHNIEEAHQLCDRIAIIHEGRVVALGSPAELIASSQINSRVIFTCEPMLPENDLRVIPSVRQATRAGGRWELDSDEPAATTRALLQHIEEAGCSLIALEVRRPSLESAFLKLTGKQN